MYKIKDYKNEKFGILDTKDNTVEYYTFEQLYSIVKRTGVKIENWDTLTDHMRYSIEALAEVIKRSILSVSMCWDSEIQLKQNGFIVSARDWGDWEVPEDCEDSDADEEDYDWKVLSVEWTKLLSALVYDFNMRYPSYSFEYQVGEKCYIYVYAERKNLR